MEGREQHTLIRHLLLRVLGVDVEVVESGEALTLTDGKEVLVGLQGDGCYSLAHGKLELRA